MRFNRFCLKIDYNEQTTVTIHKQCFQSCNKLKPNQITNAKKSHKGEEKRLSTIGR